MLLHGNEPSGWNGLRRLLADHPELGPVSDPECEVRAYDYLLRCLRLDSVPAGHAKDFSLYRSEARVHVPEGVSFHFADEGGAAPLVLTGGVEGVNFHELPAGFRFGSS